MLEKKDQNVVCHLNYYNNLNFSDKVALAKVYDMDKEDATQSHTCSAVRPSHPQDLGLAATAGRSEELFVAVFAVDGALFLHKASVCQRRLAVGAVELLLMPRLPHRYQERPSDKEETLVTFDALSVLPEPEQPSFGGRGVCPSPPYWGPTSEDSGLL